MKPPLWLFREVLGRCFDEPVPHRGRATHADVDDDDIAAQDLLPVEAFAPQRKEFSLSTGAPLLKIEEEAMVFCQSPIEEMLRDSEKVARTDEEGGGRPSLCRLSVANRDVWCRSLESTPGEDVRDVEKVPVFTPWSRLDREIVAREVTPAGSADRS